MRSGVAGFQSERLVQARRCRGLTQTALASLIAMASGTVSKWESGDQVPEMDALDKLSDKLAVPRAWFLRPLPDFGSKVCFYRSKAAITKEAQNISNVRLQWLNEISLCLQEWVDWPEVNIPCLQKTDHRQITDAEIEEAAIHCRRTWKLGMGPISDVVLALENAGAICVREELGFTQMDGASRWFETDRRPYVFLASDKANGVRSRFDAAHELGHLVLHRAVDDLEFAKRYPELERQANYFAGVFLLPSEQFASEVSRPSLDTFLALKPRWKVSIAAMIMRCKQLGIIDDEYAVRMWKNYSARGWRRGEPLDQEIEFEPMRLLPRAINLLLSEGGMSKGALLSNLPVGAHDSEQLCGLPQGFFSEGSNVAHLQLVRLRSSTTESAKSGPSAQVFEFPIKR